MSEKYTILSVDDNRAVLLLVKHVFSSESGKYRVLTALDGQQAIEIAMEKLPDLILMDWEMPRLNGLEALKILKSDVRTKDIPVIMTTNVRKLEQAFDAGATDYIHKPIDRTELLVRSKSALSLYKLIKDILSQSEALEHQSALLEKQKNELENEKRKTDTLLLNILPFEVAEQLKNRGSVKPKHYRMVSVLFTDFEGFTRMAAKMKPEAIVKELGIWFEKFDEISEKHFVEKIKTIGDAYMCAGGLPLRNKSNPIDIVLVALKMRDFMEKFNKIKRSLGQPEWKLRIGIHTGEVVAGVIGRRKFVYDIWGDTVNTASRMESASEANRINISENTYNYIKDYFLCEHRGPIEVKNRGAIDMYFVEGLKPEYSLNGKGILPNREFKKILAYY